MYVLFVHTNRNAGCRNMKGKIINWEFKELEVESRRSWVRNPINALMMHVLYETTEGTYICPVFREPENKNTCELIDLELKLNLKLQHGANAAIPRYSCAYLR